MANPFHPIYNDSFWGPPYNEQKQLRSERSALRSSISQRFGQDLQAFFQGPPGPDGTPLNGNAMGSPLGMVSHKLGIPLDVDLMDVSGWIHPHQLDLKETSDGLVKSRKIGGSFVREIPVFPWFPWTTNWEQGFQSSKLEF